MNNFTMSEYIEINGLNVSPQDPTATKLISKHLREKGYRRMRRKVNGKFNFVWTSDPVVDYADLQKRLGVL